MMYGSPTTSRVRLQFSVVYTSPAYYSYLLLNIKFLQIFVMRLSTFCCIPIISLFSLVDSQCPVPCGVEGQYCCTAGEICTVNSNNEALCTTAAASCQPGTWVVLTDTRIATVIETRSVIYASYILTTTCPSSPPVRPTITITTISTITVTPTTVT